MEKDKGGRQYDCLVSKADRPRQPYLLEKDPRFKIRDIKKVSADNERRKAGFEGIVINFQREPDSQDST